MLQPKLSALTQRKFQLKPVSWAVIMAEGLDLATTFGAFSVFPQMWEANPVHGLLGSWGLTILAKMTATLLVVIILEKVERWPRPVWLVPMTAGLPVIWNLASILAELMA
jgi:hypothetical protein